MGHTCAELPTCVNSTSRKNFWNCRNTILQKTCYLDIILHFVEIRTCVTVNSTSRQDFANCRSYRLGLVSAESISRTMANFKDTYQLHWNNLIPRQNFGNCSIVPTLLSRHLGIFFHDTWKGCTFLCFWRPILEIVKILGEGGGLNDDKSIRGDHSTLMICLTLDIRQITAN